MEENDGKGWRKKDVKWKQRERKREERRENGRTDGR